MTYQGVPSEKLEMWANEVRYLHSLFRSSQNPDPNPDPDPDPDPNPNSSPINPSHTPKRKARRGRKRPRREQPQPSDGPSVEIEWPIAPSVPSPTLPGRWPEFVRKSNSRAPPSAKDPAKVTASTVNQNAIIASRQFFSNSDSEDDDESDDDEDEIEEQAAKFFLGLFEVDGELRSYYEKNCDDGEFSCLVCGGVGVRIGKKYKGCVGLVQHASSIPERRGPHRGFRRAVCRVVGWDVSRLPNIVLDLGETLGQSLAKAAEPHNDLPKENDIDQTTEIPNHDLQKDGANGELSCMEAKELTELTTSSNPNPDFLVISATLEKGSKKKEQEKLNRKLQPPDSLIVENEWPLSSNYPSPKPTPKTSTTPLSMEEQAKVAALRLQQNGLRASQDFLKKDDSSNYNGDGEKHGNDSEEGAFKFFLGLFERDRGLRIYYEKNYGSGEFCCLVCGGTGVKTGNKYKDCIEIVQHSNSISNTKWIGTHRGFGKAVCQVLGWDICRLPSIVHDLAVSLGQPLEKAANPQNDVQKENKIEKIIELPNKDGAIGEFMYCMEAMELPRNYNSNPKVDQGTSTLTKESKKRKKEKKSKKEAQQPDPGVVENKCSAGWLELPPKHSRTLLSVEELANVTVSQVQQNGLRAACDFLKKGDSSDAGEEDENEREEEAFEFFLGLFERDEDLRIYYEKNCGNGDFWCLVCGRIGEKIRKRFRKCVGMVQHSKSIVKTKRRGAHRGFGRAICGVLGWDISSLPNILDHGESLGQSLTKAAQNQKDGTFGVMMAGEEPKESIELSSLHMEGASEEKEKLLEQAEALDYVEAREVISLSSDDD